MKTIETKAEFLDLLTSEDACAAGKAWVRKHPSNKAEDIWLDIPRLDWMTWLLTLYNVTFPKAAVRDVRWHMVQTCLDVLGAEFVQKYDINKPLANAQSLVRVNRNLRDLVYLSGTTLSGVQRNSIDVLLDIIYDIHQKQSRVRYIDYVPVTRSLNLNQRLLDDIRHVVSWEDFCHAYARW